MRKTKSANLIQQVFLLILLFSLGSCASQKTATKTTTPAMENFSITSKEGKEKCIEKIIDFLMSKNISTKNIDNTNGIIVTNDAKLSWSFKNDKGKLEKPDAYAVVQKKLRPSNSLPIKPYLVTGIWNFRIKKSANGDTEITIFLSNTKALQMDNSRNITDELLLRVSSSGQFEKEFSEFMSK